MNQIVTKAIVLSRVNYGEADRVLTLLTPTHGKITVMAKGVRRVKSKLAGSIELFCVSEITYIAGRNNGMGTLISARLVSYYDKIVLSLDRTTLGYDVLRLIHKITEDDTEEDYFNLAARALAALDDVAVPVELIRVWFSISLLSLVGQAPNLLLDANGEKLDSQTTYNFDIERMSFARSINQGRYSQQHIKLLRLATQGVSAKALSKIENIEQLATDCLPLIRSIIGETLRV